MDDQYKEGFDRFLSDMGEPPSWEQVSTQRAAVSPARPRRYGLLVAAAAFAVTVVAVGAVALTARGRFEPVAAPIAETVDHVRIAWTQDVVLRCEDMDTFDNGGAEQATIDIWGPNANGFTRVDAAAPDGTVVRLIYAAAPDGVSPDRAWASHDWAGLNADAPFRVAGCVVETAGGSSSYSMADAPIHPFGHSFGAFVTIPVENRDGSPRDVEADQLRFGATVTDDEWRGIPVRLFTQNTSGSDELGAYASTVETWFDPAERRYERRKYASDHEVLGQAFTTVEVVRRDTVPADSVSFSTDGLTLTFDRSEYETPDDSEIVTTTSIPTLSARPWADEEAWNAAMTWVNQTGLSQGDPGVWRSRLDRICEIGPPTDDAESEMSRLAGEFTSEDAELSVRVDGMLPTPDEAAESLWTIAYSQACPNNMPAPTATTLSVNTQVVKLAFASGDWSDCANVELFDRTINETADPIGTAFLLLLAGPSPAETADGAQSLFTQETVGMLRSVDFNDGLLVIGFDDLRPVINNASTSCMSASLLAQLDATAFQFPEVERVTYEIGGSCDTFYNWLERDCGESQRP